MSHIESVEIHNIQSHKKTTLKLHKGVNAIVGISDSGKSGIFRAIAWGVTNKPAGDALRSNRGGDPSVTINFADDRSVERAKIGKDNLYIVDGDEDDAFTAFKSDIPEAVLEALNMDEINLQTQMEAPFLLSASSGDVAKTLNRIANLTNIDTSLSNIRKRAQGVTRDIVNVKEQIDELEKEEKDFAYLAQMKKDVDRLDSLIDKWQSIDDEHAELENLLAEISEKGDRLDDFEILVSFESQVEEALTTHAAHKEVFQHEIALEFVIKKIERLHNDLRSLSNVDEVEAEVEKALKLQVQRECVHKELQKLNSLCGSIQVLHTRLTNVEEDIVALERQFHDEFPNKCPLCGDKR